MLALMFILPVILFSGAECEKSGTTTALSTTQSATTTATTQQATSTTQKTTTSASSVAPQVSTSTYVNEDLFSILSNNDTITSVYYEMSASIKGIQQKSVKVWAKGFYTYADSTVMIEMPNELGGVDIYLYDGYNQSSYLYNSTTEQTSELQYQSQNTLIAEADFLNQLNPTILGTQMLDGKECLMVSYPDGDITVKMWIWKDWGFPLRKEIISPTGTNVFEYKNITFDSVSDDVFKLPQSSS